MKKLTFVLVLLILSSVAYADLNDGLTHVWNLENNTDYVGGHDLNQSVGTPTYGSTESMNGDSLELAGSEYVYSGSNHDMTGTGDKTITGWIYYNSFAGSPYPFSIGQQSANAEISMVGYTSGSNKAAIDKGTGYTNWGGTLSTGQWYFYAITKNSTHHCIWVDNSGEVCESTSLNTGSSQFYIGARTNGADTLNGYIDEVYTWNRSLSPVELSDLYNSGTGKFYPFSSPASAAQIVQSEDVGEKDFTQEVFVNNVNYQTVASDNFTISENETEYIQTKIVHVGSAANTLTCRIEVDGNYYNSEKSRTQAAGEKGTLTLMTSPLDLPSGTYTSEIQCKRTGGGQIDIKLIQENIHAWNASVNYTYSSFSNLTSSSDLTAINTFTVETGNYSENQIVLDYTLAYTNLDTSAELAQIMFEIAGNNCTTTTRDVDASGQASIKGGCMIEGLDNLTSYNITMYATGANANITGKAYARALGLNSTEISNYSFTNQNLSSTSLTKIANFTLENINFGSEDIFVAFYTSINSSTSGDANFYINVTGAGTYAGDLLNVSTQAGLRNTFIKEVFTSAGTGTYQIELWASCTTGDCNIDQGKLVAYMAGDIPVVENTDFTVFAFDFFTNATINNFNLTTSENLTFVTSDGSVQLPSVLNEENFTVRADGYAYTSQIVNTTGSVNASIYLYTKNSFDILFYDEETLDLLDSVTVTAEIISDIYSNNYTTANGSLYVDLLSPEEYTIRYSATGYDERLYYITLNQNTYNNLSLYLLNSSSSSQVTATVYDETNDLLEDVFIKVLRYDLATNSYQIKEIEKTNFGGEAILNLVLNDEFYKFILEKPLGTILYTSSPTKISQTSITFQVILGSQPATEFFESLGITTSLTFNNDTDTFSFTYTDNGGTTTQGCLEVYEDQTITDVLLDSTCVSGAAGSTTYTLSNPVNGTRYYARAYAYPGGTETFLTQKDYTYPAGNLDFGKTGLFLTLLMLLVVPGLFLASVPTFIITGPLILILARYMGLLDLSYGVLIPLLWGAIALAAVLGRR